MMILALLALVGAGATPAPPQAGPRLETFTARGPDGAALGDVVITSETRPGGDRPVVFAFNGGPGAGSVWLGLGVLGARRIATPADPAAPLPRPLPLVDNPDGIVAAADLVLVDPLGTGFSRARPGVPADAIYDWRADGAYLAGVVRDWLKAHGRERAPVYLIGESYGTERAVALADALAGNASANLAGVDLAGVVLVSQSITVENTRQRAGNDLGTAVGLPTIAATACHLRRARRIAAPLSCAERAYEWALARYLPGLMLGDELAPARRRSLTADLSALSGLPRVYFERNGLALTKDAYRHAALAWEGQVLGVYDARARARIVPGRPAQDPSIDDLLPAMTEAARRYYRERFGIAASPIDATPYIVLDGALEAAWRYGPKADPYIGLDMAGVLARALRRHNARLMIAGGLYDTAGSYGADRYLASHIPMPPGTVTRFNYGGGHMFYLDGASRIAFARDLKAFLRSGAGVAK